MHVLRIYISKQFFDISSNAFFALMSSNYYEDSVCALNNLIYIKLCVNGHLNEEYYVIICFFVNHSSLSLSVPSSYLFTSAAFTQLST